VDPLGPYRQGSNPEYAGLAFYGITAACFDPGTGCILPEYSDRYKAALDLLWPTGRRTAGRQTVTHEEERAEDTERKQERLPWYGLPWDGPDHPDEEDAVLYLRYYTASDKAALTDLFRKYWLRAVGWARARLNATVKSEAEAVVEDVFAKLIDCKPVFEERNDFSFKSWLKVMVANRAVDYNREGKRRRAVPLDQGGAVSKARLVLGDVDRNPASQPAEDIDEAGAFLKRPTPRWQPASEWGTT
jgi:DNA-directed RNA polymerase specialized sigma24 family protein